MSSSLQERMGKLNVENVHDTGFIVLVVGATGAGKSTFINRLLGVDKAIVGDDLLSCTSQLQPFIVEDQFRLQGVMPGRWVIVDTPGFSDTYVEDDKIWKQISEWLTMSLRSGSIKIGGAIFLHEISQVRMLKTSFTNAHNFKKLCAEYSVPAILLATTKWDTIEAEVGDERERALSESLPWKEMLGAGAQQSRFNNDSDSAWGILNAIANRYRIQNLVQEKINRGVVQSRRTPLRHKQSSQWKRKEKMLTRDDPVIADPRPTDFIVPIMGASGAGKSTFINKLLGEDIVAVGYQLMSCTGKLRPIIIENDSRLPELPGRLVIVDTPGFDDTYIDDAEILRRISVWLAASYSDSMKIGGVIFLHEISQVRMLGTALTNTNVFRKLCGEDNMSSVILATTKWDITKKEVGERREKELLAMFWREMLEAGAQDARFLHDSDSAWAILNTIVDRYRKQDMRENILQIQQELVDLQKIIPDTEAAKSLRVSLEQALEMQKKNADGKETQEQINKIRREIVQLKVNFGRRILVALGGT